MVVLCQAIRVGEIPAVMGNPASRQMPFNPPDGSDVNLATTEVELGEAGTNAEMLTHGSV